MPSKISWDRKLKSQIGDFFAKAEAAACRSPTEAAEALNSVLSGKSHSRMVDGITFKVNGELNSDALDIAQAISKKLGPLAGDENHVSKTLWSYAAARLKNPKDIPPTVDDFLVNIDSHATTLRRHICESRVLRLETPIELFDLGPVRLITGDCVAKELNELASSKFWQVKVGQPSITLDLSGGSHVLGIGQCNWDIRIVAADAHLAEEASWLAGIAISLLRLAAGSTLGAFGCRNGQVEPHVFRHATSDKTAIVVTETGVSTGGWSLPPEYWISQGTLAYCAHAQFQAIVSAIFEPARNSVGERIRQSLGWQARGRQSDDRAERMLYFFTAMEAMLSGDDQSAPVVQTIARNAAFILTDKPDGRAKNAKLIKDLYTDRSALVHAGKRKVTKRQADTLQLIVENVCWLILDQVDMAQSVQDFQHGLLAASFGSPWGNKDAPRLPRPLQ